MRSQDWSFAIVAISIGISVSIASYVTRSDFALFFLLIIPYIYLKDKD